MSNKDLNRVDPVTLEVIRQDLVSIPNQIDKNITRTAFSPLINEYKDYAVGLVDPQGRLISQSRGSLAIFVANALGTAVKDGIELFGEDGLRQGDIVISNHAATLGQHLNNVVMYTPVRLDGGQGRIAAFFCVLMHWIDIGGIMVGSCTSTSTTEIFQEGIQLRSVKLVDRGERRADVFRIVECNTRFPEMLMGDIESQISGCVLGAGMLQDVISKYGIDAYDAAVHRLWDQAEQRARALIRAAPDGIYKASSFLDNDGVDMDATVPIGVAVEVRGDTLTVDFSEVSDQLRGPLNAGRNGGAVAAARIAMKYLLASDEPVNEGDFRPLNVAIPDGKFLSARPNAPLGGSGNMIPTVVDTILKAMAGAFPLQAAAAHHGTYGTHAFHGSHLGRPFFHLDTSIGGWGASSQTDGWGPSRSNVHGDTSDVPVEMQEAFYPYRMDYCRIREDAAGPGRQRGGNAIEKQYTIAAPCNVNLKIDRTKCAPWGVAGGLPGASGRAEIHRAGGGFEVVLKGNHPLATGDRVRILTGGGGGYGPPSERDPAAVRKDVAYGYLSPAAAEHVYGLPLDAAN